MSKHKAECLKTSLKKYGQCEALVIQPDGKIVGGHQRLRTLRALGISEVDVAIPSRELSGREEQELTIGLNKICGQFDDDMLANRWDPLILCEAGFTEEELNTDIIPKEKPKSFSINLKFDSESDLRDVEKVLGDLLLTSPTFKMKARCK
jgi:ParB-like chromosome segregation protein Spo0J